MAYPEPHDEVRVHGTMPLLPLKEVVVFPRMVVPLLVGRPASLAAVELSLASGRLIFLCTQRDANVDTPDFDGLYTVGVGAQVLHSLRMPDGTMKIVVEAVGRGLLQRIVEKPTHTEAKVRELPSVQGGGDQAMAMARITREYFAEYARLGQRIAPEVAASLQGVEDPDVLSDIICAHMSIKLEERQELLEARMVPKRLELLCKILIRENELLGIERKVRDRVREQMDRGQRDYYLNEQIKQLQQELGQRDDGPDEFSEMRELIAKAKMPKEVEEKANRELSRYERMPPMSPESSVIRTYIEWLTDMPWSKRSKDLINLDRAMAVLDEDHYGLEKVKERILEFLAVRKLSKSTRGPVLCLVGPPGVGKTSLGRSIAKAMGREFVRVSLGGIRDEAEIRGHRRTYIGSLPGRIIQSIKKCGVKNPLFMLDEIDKMASDFRGDPASALLEVLDPEQNHAFSDHFLEVDFDLHEVFFVTTANNEYEIPEPLLDRMEMVRLSGYTHLEKQRISTLFLVPKQMKECGIGDADVAFKEDGLDIIIHRYTHEAGVRELERQIANVCRKVAKEVVSAKRRKRAKTVVDAPRVMELLGPPPYNELRAETEPHIGVAIGLAWTSFGGDVLSIETTIMKGKGNVQLTGQLGEIMQESAQAAYTYLRVHAKRLGVPEEFWKNMDLHLHVPEGAIPKDGPSAGVSMAVSMLSALRKSAPRGCLAMTGEITLQGRVLPIGGVKEKVLAAHRAGMKTVLMPLENEKDMVDIPKEVAGEIEIEFIASVDDLFRLAFPPSTSKPKARPKSRPKAKPKKRIARK